MGIATDRQWAAVYNRVTIGQLLRGDQIFNMLMEEPKGFISQ